MTTNVPRPQFTAVGFVAPPESEILQGVLDDFNEAFGGNLNPALNTPQGQLASSEASIVGNVYNDFVYLTNQFDPAYAQGRYQDALARIYFLERIASAPTVLEIECSGQTGVVIPEGALIQDSSGNVYGCSGSGAIGVNGTVSLNFAAQNDGPTAVPDIDGVSIYQAIPGWDSVICLGGVVGNDTESRAQFEERRQEAVASNSIGALPSVQGAILRVDDVLDAYVTDNSSGTGAVVVRGVSIKKNSIYCCVTGGTDADVAEAIWRKKAPGCDYTGNTTVVVEDTSAGYSPPYPSYNVTFQRPSSLRVAFKVTIVDNALVPADAEQQIKAALISAFAGGDGSARARIGSTIYATRYVPPLIALGSWCQIASILVGSPNSPSATVNGSINGTLMTVTSVVSGVLAVGQFLASGSALSGTGIIAPGTVISSLISGTGGTGTYRVSVSRNVAAGRIIGFLAASSSVDVNIDQSPSLSTDDITVVLI